MNTRTRKIEPKTETDLAAKPGKVSPNSRQAVTKNFTGRSSIKTKTSDEVAKENGETRALATIRRRHARREIESVVVADLTLEKISKQAKLIALLKQKGGTTLSAMMTATGWQAHSVRGAISGILRKKLGLAITSTKQADGSSTYRIVA